MTYPSPPSEMVDFNTGRAVPNHDIGRQFAEQARSIRTIINFIESCFRADGRLKNSTIGREQLDPDIAGELSSRALSALGSLLTRVEDLANEAVLAKIDAQNARDRAEACLERVSRLEREGRRRGEEVLSRLNEREAFELNAAPQTFAAASIEMQPMAASSGDSYLGAPGLVSNRTVLDASVYGAEQWAEVSLQWAEHLPDTIPPNILAMNAITGQHWSSRWWAAKSAGAFGMLAWLYCGALDEAPTQTLTGDPLTVGALWFDTTTHTMKVWSGTAWGWEPLSTPQKAYTASLFYNATAGQTLFSFLTADILNNSFALKGMEGVEVYVNGHRLTPDANPTMTIGDYYVDVASSTMTLARAVPAGTMVAIDVLQPTSELAPGAVTTAPLENINTPAGTQNGTQTTFNLVVAATGIAPTIAGAEELLVSVDGVIQEPGVQFTALGGTITFLQAPAADSYVFILWYKHT